MLNPVITTQPKKLEAEEDRLNNAEEDPANNSKEDPVYNGEEKLQDAVSLTDVNPTVEARCQGCCDCWNRFKRGCRGINCNCSSGSCSCCANTDPEACEDLFWCCLSFVRWSAFTDCWDCCVKCSSCCVECGGFFSHCCLDCCTKSASCCLNCWSSCLTCECMSGMECGDCGDCDCDCSD